MITFESLWKNFPVKDEVKKQCTNKQKDSNSPFSDYCAILLSDCFIKSGIDIGNLSATRCWSHSGEKHILLAEQFAKALESNTPLGLAKMKKVTPESFQGELSDKTGVIFFKDYWKRGSESFESRSGDHIDLWNKDQITGSGMLMRSIYEFFGAVSDLNESKEVWFWEVQ